MRVGHVFDLLAAYAEDQLNDQQRARVDHHLTRCVSCQQSLADIRAGIVLASAIGREPMPAPVAARIQDHIARGVGTSTLEERVDITPLFWRVAAAILLLVASTALYWQMNRPWIRLYAASVAPSQFEREGRRLHERIKSGDAPPTFRSTDEQALWRWLATQHAPVTSMVVSRPEAERAQIVPVGAAVYELGRVRTSVLSYRIDGRPVTLALASSRDIQDAPAPGWWSKRVFHRQEPGGINTLTWTVGGGTYVMVSELQGAGQKACRICHTAPRFLEAIGRLNAEN